MWKEPRERWKVLLRIVLFFAGLGLGIATILMRDRLPFPQSLGRLLLAILLILYSLRRWRPSGS